MQLGRG